MAGAKLYTILLTLYRSVLERGFESGLPWARPSPDEAFSAELATPASLSDSSENLAFTNNEKGASTLGTSSDCQADIGTALG